MSTLEPTIKVRMGEEEFSLTDALKQAATQEGATHLVIRRGSFPHFPYDGQVMKAEDYEALVKGFVSIFDLTQVGDVATGEWNALYDLSRAARQPNVMELVKR